MGAEPQGRLTPWRHRAIWTPEAGGGVTTTPVRIENGAALFGGRLVAA